MMGENSVPLQVYEWRGANSEDSGQGVAHMRKKEKKNISQLEYKEQEGIGKR